MSKPTIINGTEVDLSGVTIDVDRISCEDFSVKVDCSNKLCSEQIVIVSVLKGLFGTNVRKSW